MAESIPEKQRVDEQAERSLVTAGQRRVNIMWEVTQSIIAITVTIASLYIAGVLALNGNEDNSAFLLMSNAFFLIIGFYFSRTNHSKTGGVGYKDGSER